MKVTDSLMENVTHGMINTKDITVDELGQRDVERRIRQFHKIMREFDPLKVNDLKVALVDGKYFCFDGQLTMKVLKARNKGKDLEVPCKIYTGLTMLDIANLFCAQNDNRSPVKVTDILRVKANYGDQDAIDFIRFTEKAGVDISWNRQISKNAITAVSTAYKCFNRFHDKNKYSEMLSVMKSSWRDHPDAYAARLLSGMTEFYVAYGDSIDSTRLINKLKYVVPTEIIRDAQIDRSSGARKYAVIILQIYNRGLREDRRLANRL